jgi:hypothetical protein
MILSCAKKQNVSTENHFDVDKIVVDIHKKNTQYTFDDFFRYSHHISLQTTDSSLLSKINKMQIINKKLYILDITDAVFVFDLNGNFIKKIYHKGQAGDEYIKATDFEIDDDENVYICDFFGKKIIKYDKNDRFVLSIPLRIKGQTFKWITPKRLALNIQNGSSAKGETIFYNYVCCENNDIICKAIPFNENLQGLTFSYGYGSSSFYTYHDEVFLISTLNDTIYTVNQEGCLNPYVEFDFGMKKPGLSLSKQEIEQYLAKQRQGDIVTGIYGFCLFDDYLFISFDYQGQSKYVISKKNELPLFIGNFDFNKHGLHIIPVSYLSTSQKHQLATIVEPGHLPKLLKRRKITDDLNLLEEMQKFVIEDNNPILVFYDWDYKENK